MKAEEYLSHQLGHEGKGSILNFLKTRGWATSIYAGVPHRDRLSFAYIFRIIIDLTDEGVWKICEVIGYIYQFLKLMAGQSPQEWVFDELRIIRKLEFLMAKEKTVDSYAIDIVEKLRVYPPHHVIYAHHTYDACDKKMICDILGHLKPGNIRRLR